MAVSAGAQAQTVHYPVTDFTAAQNQVTGWNDPATGYNVFFDAFGVVNNPALNTQYGGDLSIHDNGDGTQRVVLVLHTKDGLCWGTTPAVAPAAGSLPAFGRSSWNPALGQAPSVGDGLFRFEFTMAVGDPLPRFGTVLGQAADAMATVSISCKGELRTNVVTGFVDGQPGFAHTTQTALFDTGADAEGTGCPPESDANCFPSERVTFKAVGKKN
jgi:hypothetical protein